MKLVLFDDYRPGVLTGGHVTDVSAAVADDIMRLPGEHRINEIITRFTELRSAIADAAAHGERRPLADLTLRAPTPAPHQMLFAVGNYREGLKGFDFPLDLFLKSPSSILDPGGTVLLPEHDAQLYFHEAELGVVIGRRGHNIPAADAMEYVFGYTAVNDVSSYGLPGQIGGLRSKSFDTFCPMGPCIATADEIADPQDLRVRLWVDDVLRQDYHTSDMEHTVAEVIEFASHVVTLRPGDVLSCGTNHSGIGPIQDGETITLDIDRIGGYQVHVSDPLHRRWPVGPDPTIEAGTIQLKTTGVGPDSYFTVRRTDVPGAGGNPERH